MNWKMKSLLVVAAMGAGSLIFTQENPVQNKQDEPLVNQRIIRNEEGLRQVRLLEDRDQKFMTSKVYELKHVRGSDMTVWVQGAIKRYYSGSTVERLSYGPGKKHFIVVNTGVDMIPWVDDMVAKLDRPGKLDEYGSLIDGSGMYRFIFYPKYRGSADMLPIGPTVGGSADGQYYYDSVNNFIYWKDSSSDGRNAYDWYSVLDRPLPQMEVKLNIYEINDGDLKELGIDYVSWKNGPGANLFGAGLDFLKFDSFTDISNVTNSLDVVSKFSHTWGGFMVAPQIDATFVRLLNMKGKARISTSGSITVVNDFNSDPGNNGFKNAKYKIRFTPDYQDIRKDQDQNTSIGKAPMDIEFYLRNPIINFKGGYETNKQGTGEFGKDPAQLEFGYVMKILDTVEKTSAGTDVQNSYTFRSWSSVSAGNEKLLASYDRDQLVKQNNGIPFLCDIPGLKYLAGSAVESKSKTKVFITVSVSPIKPETDLSQWAGKLVSAAELAVGRDIPEPVVKPADTKQP